MVGKPTHKKVNLDSISEIPIPDVGSFVREKFKCSPELLFGCCRLGSWSDVNFIVEIVELRGMITEYRKNYYLDSIVQHFTTT